MQNIEIGIDLGTTNSEISVIKNGDIQVIKNSYGDMYTPSVVGVNKAKNVVVGKKAYEALNKFTSEDELLNNKAEIKRLMGTKTEIEFPRVNKKYMPEEISAEILKSLKSDALSMYNDINTKGVVITVPAYFSTVQAEATKRAGQIAGFQKVLLLQEPIAAAISYGFNKKIDENWLVYDLGGGTFDVALISSKNGDLRVIEHNGDNFLGGKDVDFAIIDTIIIPKLEQKFTLKNFNRGNEKYKTIFQKIKYNVEQAKIQLSRLDKAEVECDFEIDGEAIFDTIILSTNDLEIAASNLIKKTITLCNETIKNSGIDKNNISRIILVGGPTQLPCIRKQLEDNIGIFVDTTADPLTAVAKGACIYASGQQIDDDTDEIDENVYKINLYYESLSAEDEELIVGEILELKNVDKDYYIQIQNTNNTFSSEKIKLQDGKFKVYLPLEERKLNSFWIYLLDDNGVSLQLSQDNFNIIQGLNVAGAPLPKSIGLLFFEEDFLTKEKHNLYEIIFPKNSILPLSKTIRCKTAKTIKKGEGKENLGIYIYEGESTNVDRNMEICSLEINGGEIFTDILSNSDVEIKLSIDESRTLDIKAYFPDLDQEFNARSSLYDPDVSIEQLEDELNDVKKDFNAVQNLCDVDAREVLIDEINDVQRDLQSARIDADDKCKAHSKLKRIKIVIDNLSSENSADNIFNKFDAYLVKRYKMEEMCGNDEVQKELLYELFQKGEEAQRQNNIKMLSMINQELSDLYAKLLFNDKNFLLALSSDLYHNQNLKDNPIATEHFNNFIDALERNSINEMKDSICALMRLLPRDEQDETKQRFSGIRKI